jgi:hypothetical protein
VSKPLGVRLRGTVIDVKLEVDACDLGLTERYGRCSLDTQGQLAERERLSPRQRASRALAGLGFHAVAILLGGRRMVRPLAVLAHWFGASHLVASATAYPGCPELGAIPSLLLGRRVATECGPWEWIDERLDRSPAEPISVVHASGRP